MLDLRPPLRQFASTSILLGLISLIFWPALSGGFVFDDYPVFVENPVVHITSWHWQPWYALWVWSHANIQRPLAMLSYAVNFALGASTWGFKATNLFIHLLNTVLVWLLSKRLLWASWRQTFSGAISTSRVNYWALGVAAAWAMHPLQVSSVMYVVQRMELMGFTFVLLALLAYWRARQHQQSGERAWPWLVLVAVLIAIGYNAKETAVLVPGYTLLMELTMLRFAAARPSTSRGWKLIYVLGCVAAVGVVLGYMLPHYATTAAYANRDFTAWQRELTQLRVLPMYLGWSVLPLPALLHFYYDNYAASLGLLDPVSTLVGGLFLAALFGTAIAVRNRRPLLALGIGWFFVANALTSSPLPLELAFEHRNYPALLGVMLALADLTWLYSLRIKSIFPAIVAIVFIINLGFLTLLRAGTWSSPLQLAETMVHINPGSPRAALDLARRYVAMSGDNPSAPLYSLGIRELERAAQLPSSSILPEQALIIQAANHPGLDDGVWWDSLQEKLRSRPMGPETHLALNGLLRNLLQDHTNIDAHQLAKTFEIATAREPSQANLHADYAELAGAALHDPTLAIEQWQQVLELEKNVPSYPTQLATYLVNNHRDIEALGVITKAESIQPALRHDEVMAGLRAKAAQAKGSSD